MTCNKGEITEKSFQALNGASEESSLKCFAGKDICIACFTILCCFWTSRIMAHTLNEHTYVYWPWNSEIEYSVTGREPHSDPTAPEISCVQIINLSSSNHIWKKEWGNVGGGQTTALNILYITLPLYWAICARGQHISFEGGLNSSDATSYTCHHVLVLHHFLYETS